MISIDMSTWDNLQDFYKCLDLIATTVQQDTEAMFIVSQLLHPHIRQRARRSFKGKQSKRNHMHQHLIPYQPQQGEDTDSTEASIRTRSRVEIVTTEARGEEAGDTNITSAEATNVEFEEPKLKRSEES
ncbi:hypothetical protein R1flu_028345 [Riccia fluitans]|uniref:Uncharacterized protein n=1 Tax=Riccia fluitans TaxID=41844 RepID=A0ABD1XLD8_9MARC